MQMEITDLETFTMEMWISRLERSGLFSPRPPFKGCLKSTASMVSDGCSPPPPISQETRKSVMITDTGYSILTFGLLPYEFTYPMLCWVGDEYDY